MFGGSQPEADEKRSATVFYSTTVFRNILRWFIGDANPRREAILPKKKRWGRKLAMSYQDGGRKSFVGASSRLFALRQRPTVSEQSSFGERTRALPVAFE